MMPERKADHPIAPLFLNRWSPRAFEASSMPRQDLLSLLEAARWAPSAYNLQPWRFLYALREDAIWPEYVSLLDTFNAGWAKQAAALIFIVSDTEQTRRNGDTQKLRSHSFDAGAAWAQMALQATVMGYQAHAMAGIEFAKSRDILKIPNRFRVEIAVAVGKQANPAQLPENLQKREFPSQRRPLEQTAFAGVFPHHNPMD